MVRKLSFALILAGATFLSTSASSKSPAWTPACEEYQPPNPCDVVCGEEPDPEMTCDCPCWTDRRVKQSTCDIWNGISGCWYF